MKNLISLISISILGLSLLSFGCSRHDTMAGMEDIGLHMPKETMAGDMDKAMKTEKQMNTMETNEEASMQKPMQPDMGSPMDDNGMVMMKKDAMAGDMGTTMDDNKPMQTMESGMTPATK